MVDPTELVHIVDEVPEIDDLPPGEDGARPPLRLVLALDGFLDTGRAGALAASHLEALSDGPVVATFDVDVFHDYRARRPPVTFVRDHYADYEAPRLLVRLRLDSDGTPFLLMRGPEPDGRWEGFARAVRAVLQRFEVERVVAIGSVPMAVPHTRPVAITPHANDPSLLTTESPWRGELRVPSSAQSLLELRLGEWGHAAMGFVAHVPHYLAQMDYPRASLALLEHVEQAAGLSVDLDPLRSAAEASEGEIGRYLAANGDVQEVVEALEQQYDAFRRAEEDGASLLAEERPLPTGEEIGQQFEQFLARLDDADDGDEGGDDGPTGDGGEDRS